MSDPPPRTKVIVRLVGEFAIIVLGVLVALGVDRWTEDQAMQRRETELLASLAADLQASLGELRSSNVMGATRERTLEWFLTFPIDGSQDFPDDSLLSLSIAVNLTGSYSPILRTYEAMVATGSFATLSDADLQLALAELNSDADNYLDYRRQATDQWNLTYSPTWIEHMGGEALSGTSPLPAPAVLQALRDRAFRGTVSRRRTFLRFLTGQGERLADSMEDILRLLTEELKVRGVATAM